MSSIENVFAIVNANEVEETEVVETEETDEVDEVEETEVSTTKKTRLRKLFDALPELTDKEQLIVDDCSDTNIANVILHLQYKVAASKVNKPKIHKVNVQVPYNVGDVVRILKSEFKQHIGVTGTVIAIKRKRCIIKADKYKNPIGAYHANVEVVAE